MSIEEHPLAQWHEEDLERVGSCPVCGCESRRLRFGNLVDNAFFVVQGEWQLYQCNECNSAYLDPRPDRDSIHRAYGSYYTHQTNTGSQSETEESSGLRKWRRMLVNGYYNFHYGTRRFPQSILGAWLLALHTGFRRSVRAKLRFLDRPRAGQQLLDVGCGNGDFLVLAAEVGWHVKGVEPDTRAADVARSRGVDVVTGSLDEILATGERYDVVTMSHVIEHVHDPAFFTRQAFELLKPGGVLYVDTPNIESTGLVRFKQAWRALEAPRHLVIFSKQGLQRVLSESGFENCDFIPRPEVRTDIALKSYRIQSGRSPYDSRINRLPLGEWFRALMPRSRQREEFLTVLARKS